MGERAKIVVFSYQVNIFFSLMSSYPLGVSGIHVKADHVVDAPGKVVELVLEVLRVGAKVRQQAVMKLGTANLVALDQVNDLQRETGRGVASLVQRERERTQK